MQRSDISDVIARHEAGPSLRAMPRAHQWDSSLALLADPYRFIGKTCQGLGTDAFETRLLLQRTVCLSGPRAAETFYDANRFQRENAAPEALKATLFGKGAVQGLDGPRHRRRKALFMAVTAPQRVQELVERARHEWERALPDWMRLGRLPLYRAVQPVLTRAVCSWAGVPLPPSDVPRRSRQLTALFDSAASGPLRHLASRFARMRLEAWLAALVADERAGRIVLPPDTAAHVAAWQRDDDDRLLPPRIAAVELLNVLRPTVAVSVYIAFVAHALHEYPSWAQTLADPGASAEAFAFVQEVRRHYPFFPAVAARVRQAFDWNGLHFPVGRRTLLDLYGTNHDARTWDEPRAFRPERWQHRQPGRFEFVPQGGADAATHHRCPGEDVATQLMLLSLHMLLRRMRYQVAPQSRLVEMRRLPAIPQHGFIIEGLLSLS